jgi:hypothetical protein
MASTNRTRPNQAPEPTTSGSERPGRSPGEAADGWWRERLAGIVNARKSRVSERLKAVAETVRRAGEPLHEEPFSKLGGYTDGAARTIERVATGLRERDVEELAEDVRGFARSRPIVFLGAGLAAGLIAGRFLKSSGDASPRAARAAGARAQQRKRNDRGRRPEAAQDVTPAQAMEDSGVRGRRR